MKHTIERIAGKISDYKGCNSCGALNWHENENCVECGAFGGGTWIVDLDEEHYAEYLLETFEGDLGVVLEV